MYSGEIRPRLYGVKKPRTRVRRIVAGGEEVAAKSRLVARRHRFPSDTNEGEKVLISGSICKSSFTSREVILAP